MNRNPFYLFVIYRVIYRKNRLMSTLLTLY